MNRPSESATTSAIADPVFEDSTRATQVSTERRLSSSEWRLTPSMLKLDLTRFHDQLISLARRVDSIDVRQFESHTPDVLASELAPPVLALLRDARLLFVALVAECDRLSANADELANKAGPPLPYVPFEQALDEVVERRMSSLVDVVADVAFLANLEVRQRLERLERLVDSDRQWSIIGECDGSLRRLRKAVLTLDRAFSRAGFGPARLDYASELEISLEVRRAYAKLRARVRALGEPSTEELYVQLRAIGTALAILVGWKGYPNLRIRDRMQLRDLQRRLLAWFKSDRPPAEGLHLWRDLEAFVQILAAVNRRQELQEHDARVVQAALSSISDTSKQLPFSTRESLERLAGLDDEVDALLDRTADDVADWRVPLARLARELPSFGERE